MYVSRKKNTQFFTSFKEIPNSEWCFDLSGQLCTDLEEVIQERHHQEIFAVLIPTLETPVSRYVFVYRNPYPSLNFFSAIISPNRVHAHAAAALINFCEGVERDTLIPYLDPIVERLLKLLNPVESPGGKVRGYVQEQAITTLAMVADASEKTFAKVCDLCLFSFNVIPFFF